ncbi:MAG: hypothetical protein JWM53_601, partial [bacterium]|nr:hypothetical protein [bacterium]
GCSPHQDHGGGLDLSGTNGAGEDMAFVTPPIDTGDMAGPLSIAPLDQTLNAAPGMMPTLQFTATVNSASVSPVWTVDRGELGSLDVSTGLFTAAGTIGGKAKITATYLGRTASTSLTIKLSQTQNGDPGFPAPAPGPGGYGGVGGSGPGGAATGGQTAVLGGTATADANVKLLYPYDGTVWPRGLLAPLLQWNPGTRNFDAVMLKLHSKNFDYTGTFAKNATPFINLPIPQQVWHTLAYSNEGQGDDITVTLVFEDATGTPTAIGPYTQTWHVAPGTLKGTVYYNSYGTALVVNPNNSAQVGNSGENSFGTAAGNGPPFGAATLAIRPGMTAPVVVAGTYSADKTGCRVCHSVSANGQKLVTQHGDNYSTSSAYDLTTGVESVMSGTKNVWPALAPDGSWYMSESGATIATGGDTDSQAYVNTGTIVSAQPSGVPAGLRATLPTFSPDSKHLSFNFWASTSSGGDQKSLAALDYDPTNRVFSNLRTLFTPTTGTVSWSSFLPTNDAVVFEDELVSGSGQYGFTWKTGQGQLYWVDLATKTPHALDQLNGTGYLPTYGAHTGAADAKLNYEPTVNPVVSGGYAWVVFTSRRLYGNVATTDAYNSDPRLYDWQHVITPKKLWVAAIDLNAPAGTDPSHPAFYLPAQELLAGNARGFWTVDPCHTDGTGCETGDECCGGFCRPGGDAGALICTNQQPSCAQEFEKCTVTADCCGAAAGITCINGFCSKSQPIP